MQEGTKTGSGRKKSMADTARLHPIQCLLPISKLRVISTQMGMLDHTTKTSTTGPLLAMLHLAIMISKDFEVPRCRAQTPKYSQKAIGKCPGPRF